MFVVVLLVLAAVALGALLGQILVKVTGLDQLAHLSESLQHDRTRP